MPKAISKMSASLIPAVRRLRPRRAMARRFPSCSLLAAHRREGRLPDGFRRSLPTSPNPSAKVLSLTGSIRAIAVAVTAAHRRSSRRTIRWLHPEPRPDRQYQPGQSTLHPRIPRTTEAGCGPDPVLSLPAIAVHGRGIWRDRAVLLLHKLRGLRSCDGRATRGAKGNWRRITRKASSSIPKPKALLTAAKLDWSKVKSSAHAEILRLYQALIALRKQHSSLGNCRKDLTEIQFDEQSKSIGDEEIGSVRQHRAHRL